MSDTQFWRLFALSIASLGYSVQRIVIRRSPVEH